MGNAAGFGPDMGKAVAAATRVFGIIEFPSKIDAQAIDEDETKTFKRIKPEDVTGKLEFKDVWFRYPTRKEDFVLKGLNLTINPNEVIALVGESGCGKSTIVNLLMRFYDVDSGQILLDGVDIKKINLHDLRTAISLVMQEPIIFNYTILENLLYGKSDASNTEIVEAATISNCIEFIDGGHFKDIDDRAINLKLEMENKKKAIVEMIGQKKYDEEMDVMTQLVAQEEKQEKFKAVSGDVDRRDPSLRDIELTDGY